MSKAEESLKKMLNLEGEAVISLCQELVRIPSEDPPGDTRDIAGFIYDYCKKAGVEDCRIIAPHPEKPNVVATVEGTGPGPHVVFNGHMDTFPVGNKVMWSYDPFGGEISDGRLYGRGAADMKGGLASCIYSVILLNRIKDSFPGKVSVTCVSDEEVFGPWGSQYLLKNHPELHGDALINGEPSSLENIRLGEKGQYWYRFSCTEGGGHGAYASLKRGAIVTLTKLLHRIISLPKELDKTPESVYKMMHDARENFDSLLCKGATDAALTASANIGTIRGGISVNMVPEQCSAEVDFRLPPGVDPSILRDWITETMKDFPSCTAEEFNYQDAYLTEASHPLTRTALGAAEEVLGRKVYPTFSLGGTEARLWRRLGVPAITYGPNHHNMGSADEYIDAHELIDVLKVHTLTTLRFLSK